MKRSVLLQVSNLDTTLEQEEALVEALWDLVESMHPEADVGATAGPDIPEPIDKES